MLRGTTISSDVVAGFVLPTCRASLVIEVIESLPISPAGCSSPSQSAQNLLAEAQSDMTFIRCQVLITSSMKFIAHGTNVSSNIGPACSWYSNATCSEPACWISAGRDDHMSMLLRPTCRKAIDDTIAFPHIGPRTRMLRYSEGTQSRPFC